MQPTNLTLDEAQLILIKNFLVRKKYHGNVESQAPFLLECTKQAKNLIGIRDFLIGYMISKGGRQAFIDAYILDSHLYKIKSLSTRQQLTAFDCSYNEEDEELKKEAIENWRDYYDR